MITRPIYPWCFISRIQQQHTRHNKKKTSTKSNILYGRKIKSKKVTHKYTIKTHVPFRSQMKFTFVICFIFVFLFLGALCVWAKFMGWENNFISFCVTYSNLYNANTFYGAWTMNSKSGKWKIPKSNGKLLFFPKTKNLLGILFLCHFRFQKLAQNIVKMHDGWNSWFVFDRYCCFGCRFEIHFLLSLWRCMSSKFYR